jgi:isoleucyl-tRNA synthetase
VIGCDYAEDQRIGDNALKLVADHYRRLRNTFRYLLGALDGWSETERVASRGMPELERWILHRLWELDRQVRTAADNFDLHNIYMELHNFCAVDLSAFYFDIRKDALYCDPPQSPRRRAVRAVLQELFSCLTVWLAPVLSFTAEEAWRHRSWRAGDAEADSVHLRLFPAVPADWRDEVLAERWTKLRDLRRVVTGALELKRADKTIGSSLQARPRLFASAELLALADGVDLAEISITSGITPVAGAAPADAFTLPEVPDVGVVVEPAPGEKCERCWRIVADRGRDPKHPTICGRCADAVEAR